MAIVASGVQGGIVYVSVRDSTSRRETSRTASERRRSFRVSAPVIMLGLTSLFTDISSEMVAAILPLYLTLQLGLSPLGYGIIDGLYHGVTAVVRLSGGFLADKIQRPKFVATIGYGLSAGCKLLFLGASTPVAVGGVIALDRTGKGLRTAPRDSLIAFHSSADNLGYSFGVHRALDTIGAMGGPLIAFSLLAVVPRGYDAIFIASFCAALLGLAIIVLLVPGDTGRRATAPASASISLRAAFRIMRRNSKFVRSAVVAGVLALLTVSDGFLYLTLLKRDDDVARIFPLLFVGTSLVYLFLAIPLGRLADKVGRGLVFLGGHAALLGCYLAAAGPMQGGLAIAVTLILLGAYYAATDGVLSALTVPLLPAELRSSGLALMQTTVAVGKLLSSIAFGFLWTIFGDGFAFSIFSLALLAVLPIAALLLGLAKRSAPRPL